MSLVDGPGSRRSRGMIVRSGTHRELESAADEILRQSMVGVTKHSEKSDILTPWKEQARRSREVMVPSGTPDSSLRRGNFNRAANFARPHLNSADGEVAPHERRTNRWDSE